MINVDFKSILDLLKAFPTDQACIAHLESLRWPTGVQSPFEPDSKVWKCAGNKYICKSSGKTFSVRTGTLFDNTKIPLHKWFLGIFLIVQHKKGISSMQLARDLSVTQKTAWFMLQRIRACFGLEKLKPAMTDNTQLDETFVGGKNKNRHFHKKVAKSKGRAYADKTPVMGMLSGGKVIARVVSTTKDVDLVPIILKHVPPNTTVISDEWPAYRHLKRRYDHQIVNHHRKQYVNECGFTTNSIEGFWSWFKRGIIGIYHYTSRKHLQKYVDEFVFRYNTRLSTTAGRFNLLLLNIGYRLTYKQLIAA